MQLFVFNADERRGHEHQNENILHVYLFKALIFLFSQVHNLSFSFNKRTLSKTSNFQDIVQFKK